MTRLRHLLLITTALTALGLAPASAGPDGPAVVGGSASVVNPGGAHVTVNQNTDKAIINWRLFDVGTNESVRFNQPNSGSIILNRVTGGLGPSQILGHIDANGRVFVINRDGILFGPNAVINTAGFLATTHDIRNNDFMAGRFNFNMPGRPDASIVNLGTITATSGGFAALVAPGVRNSGTITATLGNVALASGNGFSLDFYGDKLVTLAVGDQIASSVRDVATGLPLKALVGNDGKIKADGGRVELTAVAARQVVDAVINTSGVIEANTVGTRNGMIVLGAATRTTKPAGAPTQVVKVSGTLKAAGKQTGSAQDRGTKQPGNAKGGTVVVTGENIQLAGAQIIATGDNGGGKVLIGGDWGGGKPDKSLVSNPSAVLETSAVPTATTVSVDAATRIDASATQNGNGGKVIVWSDQNTTFAGTILALGGREFGKGGFIETSGKTVNVSGTVNAPGGTWLLDPADVLVDAPLAASANLALNSGTNFTIATGTTPAGGNGDIFVNVPIAWNTGATLTLSAFRNIQLNDLVASPNIKNFGAAAGNLVMRADSTGIGTGTIVMNPSTFSTRVDWTNSTGKVSVYYNPAVFGTQENFTTGNGRIALASTGQITQYMLVNDKAHLQNIATNLSGTYALGRDIDASGAAINPIGNISPTSRFTGILDGAKFDGTRYTISNLTVAPNSGTTNVGLFGVIGTTGVVRNLSITNASVTADPTTPPPGQFVGVLAGENAGTVTNVSVAGTITNGTAQNGVIAGGLIGQNGIFGPGAGVGTITNSHAAVTVTVGSATASSTLNNAGGLVGSNPGTIANSDASGNVFGGSFSFIGALVATNAPGAAIANSFANGNATLSAVTGNQNMAGGLIGFNLGTITGSHATGTLSGTTANSTSSVVLGGLVGQNDASGTITNSFATGAVTGGPGASGGLVGLNSGTITNSSTSGNVTATGTSTLFAYLGGLIGSNNSTAHITSSTATGTVTTTGYAHAGGLIGDNSASLSNLSASNALIVSGPNVSAGGLIGTNNPGATIANSQAFGTITSTATNSSSIGGLIGDNLGTIAGTAVPAADQTCAAGQSCATGAISAVTGSSAGGLVGSNGGTITNSFATGAVTVSDGSNFTFSSFGGLAGSNGGTIANSFATGNVSLDPATLTQSVAGGLVGFNFGAITSSHAAGQVTGGGTDISFSTILGGFVGINDGTISNSFATGKVTGGSNTGAGGFAGANGGTITGSTAGGAVSSADNMAGGFVAFNTGTIDHSTATGAVTGNGFSTGGFVAENWGGTITDSSASGIVTGNGFVMGGFAGINAGTIANSTATGDVVTTGNATSAFVGGFVGDNAGVISFSHATGLVSDSGAGTTFNHPYFGGLAGINSGSIEHSYATGAVNAQNFSISGGLVGDNFGSITDSHATGAVTGNSQNYLGGLAGINATSGVITNSYATGPTSGGFNNVLGGFAAANAGTITQSYAIGAVSGGASSFAGGFIGQNFGLIRKSFATGAVTADADSFVGGFAGVNAILTGFSAGSITQAYATGSVTGGIDSHVGGFAAANGGIVDQTYAAGRIIGGPSSVLGGLIAVNSPSFALPIWGGYPTVLATSPGTVTNSYWDTTTTGQSTSAGGTPQTTAQLASGTTPSGFDPGVWTSTSGFYPCLSGQCSPPPEPGAPAPVHPIPPVTPPVIPATPPAPPQIVDQHPVVISPQLVVAAQLTKDPADTKPTEPVVNTTTTTTTTPPTPPTPGGPKPGGPGPGGRPTTPSWFGPNAILPSGMPALTETRFRDNEVMLQLGNGTAEQVADIARKLGLEILATENVGLLGRSVYRFRITGGLSVRDVIKTLEANKFAAQAQPIYVFELAQAPAAPAENQGDSAQYIVAKLRLPEVHTLATGKGVLVAVVDSTIDADHPDLSGVIAQRFDAVGAELAPHPHGTGMAGAIASHKRLLGIAPNARLLAIQAFGANTGGTQGTSLAIVKGLNWAVEQGAKVINMSFAGPADPILAQAIKALREKGIILIAAAGNAGPKSPKLFPGADANVIAVSATDADDSIYKNSNRGYITVAAPGVDILVPAPEGGYQLTTGTSVAAAHVSGVAALLLERNPNLKPDELKRILTSTATKLKGARPEDVGAGLVDPYAALVKVAPKTATIQ